MILALAMGAAVTMQIEVKPERPEFAVLDAVRLHLTIRNGGGAAVELANPASRSSEPAYTIRGPSFPQGKTFNKVDLDGLSSVPRPPPDSDRIRIDAGGVWDGSIALTRSLGLEQPGEYEISAKLQNAQSGTARFRVTPIAADVADGGFGLRDEGRGEGELAYFHRDADGTLVYAQQFRETRPDLGETTLSPPVLKRRAAAQAVDLRVPRNNGPFNGEETRWIVWREGARVFALDTFGTLVSADLAAPPALLVRPALRSAGEGLDVLALAEGGRGLSLVRFQGESGAMAWTDPLPAQAASIAAGIGREKKPNRHVAFAAETGDGVVIFHTRYKRGGKPEAFKSVAFEPPKTPGKPFVPPRLLKSVWPALNVDAADGATAGFLAIDGEQRVLWLEAHFAEGLFRPDVGIEATPLGLESPPVSGVLLYADKDDGSIGRREAVVRLATGELVHVKNGSVRKLGAQAAPEPMVLVPGRATSYVLLADPVRGPYLGGL